MSRVSNETVYHESQCLLLFLLQYYTRTRLDENRAAANLRPSGLQRRAFGDISNRLGHERVVSKYGRRPETVSRPSTPPAHFDVPYTERVTRSPHLFRNHEKDVMFVTDLTGD